jgi:hypothetical protein
MGMGSKITHTIQAFQSLARVHHALYPHVKLSPDVLRWLSEQLRRKRPPSMRRISRSVRPVGLPESLPEKFSEGFPEGFEVVFVLVVSSATSFIGFAGSKSDVGDVEALEAGWR